MKYIFPVILVGFCAAGSALAQSSSASQQVDALRFRATLQSPDVATNAAPEFYSGETSDVGPQTLLEMKKRRQWLRASADEQMFYSDNVFLADTGRQSTEVLVSTVQAALAPDAFNVLGGQLSPEIGYQHQWFSYGLLTDEQVQVAVFSQQTTPVTSIGVFDFNVQTVFADAVWRWHHWDFSGGLDFRRFLDSGDYEEFYRETVPNWAAHYTFKLGDNKSLTVGYEGDYRFTETQNPFPASPGDYNDRVDQSLVLIGNWQVWPHVIVQPFYRLQYSYYTVIFNGRTDWLHSFGLALQFPFTKNIALRTFASYDILRTDGANAQSYGKLDIGGGLNLSVRF